MLSASRGEIERFDRWSAMLTERRIHVLRHSFVPENAAEEQDEAFLAQMEQDIRRADILWLLYPERSMCQALYPLGIARSLREQGASGLRTVLTHASSAPQVLAAPELAHVQADFRGASDELGFHDICNAAQRIIMARTLRPPPQATVQEQGAQDLPSLAKAAGLRDEV